jgi:hypothetical protein
MTDQSKSWRQSLWDIPAVDAEQDDCDREDDDPNGKATAAGNGGVGCA